MHINFAYEPLIAFRRRPEVDQRLASGRSGVGGQASRHQRIAGMRSRTDRRGQKTAERRVETRESGSDRIVQRICAQTWPAAGPLSGSPVAQLDVFRTGDGEYLLDFQSNTL